MPNFHIMLPMLRPMQLIVWRSAGPGGGGEGGGAGGGEGGEGAHT